MSSPPGPSPPLADMQKHSTCTQMVAAAIKGESVDFDGEHDTELETKWESVKARLSFVFQNVQDRIKPSDWVEIYTDVALLCDRIDDHRKRRLFSYIRKYILDIVQAQLEFLRPLKGTALLAEYNRRWHTTIIFVRFMKRVSHHLHCYWIRDHANIQKENPVRPIDNLLMFYWREHLLTHLPVVVDIALALVDDDRRGLPVDRRLVRGLVDNLIDIGDADVISPPESQKSFSCAEQVPLHAQCSLHLYQQLFEEPFIAATVNFYKSHGNVRVDRLNVSGLMKTILLRLEHEEERAREVLHHGSVRRVRKAAEEQLIGNQIEFLQRQANEMIPRDDHDNLHVVYSLLKRVDGGLMPVRSFFVTYVRAEGNSIVCNHIRAQNGKNNSEDNLVLIEKLVELYLKHAALVQNCFEDCSVLLLAIDDAFRGFVNRKTGPVSLPNILAEYIDKLMRGRPVPKLAYPPREGKTEDTTTVDAPKKDETVGSTVSGEQANWRVEEFLTELVRFFMYLDHKDSFCEMHRRLYAKRLLTAYDEDLELLFIVRLELQMGGIYTQRFRGMLQDVRLSKSLGEKYLSFVEELRDVVHREKKVVETSTVALREKRVNDDRGVKTREAVAREAAAREAAARESVTPKEGEAVRPNFPIRSSKRVTPVAAMTDVSGEKPTPAKVPEDGDDDAVLRKALSVEMAVRVLNALHWPTTKPKEVTIPPEIGKCHELYIGFYMQDRESRKLTWAHGMSSITMSGRFGGQEYSLVMTLPQACIVLLFNDVDELDVDEIAKRINVTADVVLGQIRPLLYGRRSRLLRVVGRDGVAGESQAMGDVGKKRSAKEADQVDGNTGVTEGSRKRARCKAMPADDDATGGDDADDEKAEEDEEEQLSTESDNEAWARYKNNVKRIAVNNSFKSRQQQIFVEPGIVREANTEAVVCRQTPVVDRSTQIDAAIVRLMKAKKDMTHVELSGQVMGLLGPLFMPDPRLIKLRVERLIDMEYMTRDENDVQMYRYCA